MYGTQTPSQILVYLSIGPHPRMAPSPIHNMYFAPEFIYTPSSVCTFTLNKCCFSAHLYLCLILEFFLMTETRTWIKPRQGHMKLGVLQEVG